MSKNTITEGDSADKIARCVRKNCPCDSFDGTEGKYCGRTCRDGKACTGRYHVSPARKFAPCVRVGCPCTSSYNGRPGKYCCFRCQSGKKCEEKYHQSPSA